VSRKTFDQIRLEQLDILAERSTCDRGKPACILTKDDRILSEGYAGSPPGLPHCDDEGHLIEFRALECEELEDWADGAKQKLFTSDTGTKHCIRTVHAEANAIAWAAKRGISTDGATAYVTMTPCRDCAKLLITAGIRMVIAKKDYHSSEQTKEWFQLAGIELIIIEG